VVSVKRRAVPELDDEFAKDLGDFASLAALRERIRSDLLAVRERASRAELRRSLIDALIDRTLRVRPAAAQQLDRRLRQASAQLTGRSEDAPTSARPLAGVAPAERGCASLILEVVARARGSRSARGDRVPHRAAGGLQGASAAQLREALDAHALRPWPADSCWTEG
jgi:hypothetical protein